MFGKRTFFFVPHKGGISYKRTKWASPQGLAYPLNLEGFAFYTPFRSVLNKRHWRLGPLRAEHGRLGDIIPFVRVRILPEGFIL